MGKLIKLKVEEGRALLLASSRFDDPLFYFDLQVHRINHCTRVITLNRWFGF